MTSHSRRSFAAAVGASLGAGLALPGMAGARSREVRLDGRGELPIVASVASSPNTNQTIETSNDPYRRMTAPISLNGQGPYFFVVDTGANQSVISRELATS